MSDNPFLEPDDAERTMIRPTPGGRRPAAAPAQPPRPARDRRRPGRPRRPASADGGREGGDGRSIRWSPRPRRCCS